MVHDKLPRRSPGIGLPAHQDLVGLAKKWLEDQRRHWPDHPDTRLRDQRHEDTVAAEMATQFRDGYLRGAGPSFSHATPKAYTPKGIAKSSLKNTDFSLSAFSVIPTI
jgi:hypothetical protein